MPLAPAADHPGRCLGCRRRRFPFKSVVAVGPYRGLIRNSVILAKRAEHIAVTRILAKLMSVSLRQHDFLWRPDLITQVPTYWARRAERGYSAAEVMAETIATWFKLPHVPVLYCLRATEKQGTLSPAERQRNVAGAFTTHSGYALHGKTVLLVDDVLTTGATAAAAAKTLLAAGAAEVKVVVAARGTGHAFT